MRVIELGFTSAIARQVAGRVAPDDSFPSPADS
jgi:hypothetical protein